MTPCLLTLYVAGHTPKSENIIRHVRQLCETHFQQAYTLTVVDVLQTPEAAEENCILATPTLVREVPAPRRYIIGDLMHTEKVLHALDIFDEFSSQESIGS
jgi:circadian clock protein KaiB